MVRIHPDPPTKPWISSAGAVAQLGEHLLCKQGVVGSIPSSSTKILSVCFREGVVHEEESSTSVLVGTAQIAWV